MVRMDLDHAMRVQIENLVPGNDQYHNNPDKIHARTPLIKCVIVFDDVLSG